MRRSSLWREPPKTSICALHPQLSPARNPVRSQHRYIAFGAAAKPKSDATLKPTAKSGPAFGRSAFGNVKSSSPVPLSTPSFGRPAFGGGIASPQSELSNYKPASGGQSVQLSEEERRIKDAISEAHVKQNKREVHIIGGPGPQASRAGRVAYDEQRKIDANTKRAQALQKHHVGGGGQGSTTEHTPRREPDNLIRRPMSVDRSFPQQENAWGQLKRKTNAPSTALPIRRFMVDFDAGDAPPVDGRYTPLSPSQRSAYEGGEPFAIRRKMSGLEDGAFGESTGMGQEPVSATLAAISRATEDMSFEARQKRYEEAAAKEERRLTPKLSSRDRNVREKESGRSRNFEESDRGKKNRDKDKARRRDQFAVEYNAEADEEAAAAAAIRAEEKKRKKAERAAQRASALTPIFLPAYITVANLASAVKIRFEAFAEKMIELGFEETGAEHILNAENAGLIALEYGFEPMLERSAALHDLKARPAAKDPSILPQRPPVVTIMGHVDHGKTTLLDYLRKSSVAATEHGGITQHIGAFSVAMPSGKNITFLDTPGHAAFLNMRQRGANVTDIVILVVAADDSVKPQTIEAINHAKAAKVPIVVAINKIDKDGAKPDRVKQDLARHGVDVEDFGGDVQAVEVSGKTGQGMEELEETITTLSEVIDMRAEIDGPVEGWVLEASIKATGKVATILVRRGTLRTGDFIVAGNTWARVRCLRNEAGVLIESAKPGVPVEIDGWKDQPLAGDEVLQADTEAIAKDVVDFRLEKIERHKLAEDMEAVNEYRKHAEEVRAEEKRKAALDEEEREAEEEAARAIKKEEETGVKEVFFIIKGDVSGSVEAVVDSISPIGNKEVVPNILRSGVGQLSEFDVEHAAIAKGTLINFNTPIEPHIASMAEKAKVAILDHNVIYRLVDDVKLKLSEYLPPLITYRVIGEADVAQIFEINIKGRQHKSIAGVKVRNGTISKTSKIRVMRGGEKIFDGALSSLKNVKKDVAEMRKGSECGMGFEGWTDFQVGDQVQSYETMSEKRYL